jgi:hypothetical protein
MFTQIELLAIMVPGVGPKYCLQTIENGFHLVLGLLRLELLRTLFSRIGSTQETARRQRDTLNEENMIRIKHHHICMISTIA